jgi:IS30 family transposase
MRQIRQMLRLAHDGVSAREIGRRLGVAPTTVQDNAKRAAVAGLARPPDAEITDAPIEQRLFARRRRSRRQERAWSAII